MNSKPIQIALFIIVVLGILFGLTFLSEKGGIQKGITEEDGFSFSGFSIKYPTEEQFLGLEVDSTITKEEVLEVTQTVTPVADEVTDEPEGLSMAFMKNDSLQRPDFSKIDTTKIVRIQYPPDSLDLIGTLQKKIASGACRIIHYGDSQIEGDRISAYLRNRLQGIYGGGGPGFIPIKQVYDQVSAVVIPSDNWKRYALFDPTQSKFPHRKYGAYMSVSRFTEYRDPKKDSTIVDSLPLTKATITIGKSKKTYFKFRRFNSIGLHYGNATTPIQIKVYNDGALLQQGTLIADENYHIYTIKTAVAPTNLTIELEGRESADFYGVTLDAPSGIQIDNVAMRGASGTVFTTSNAASYARMARVLKPKIVIMQYGGNTMPYLKDSTKVDNYAKRILGQINWIRRRTKNVSFIFIGPTDMCLPVNGKMETYPLLPYLNQKLMETCTQNNVAYWSMYDAMGGKGSMKFWVEEKLTGSDYMHFTHKGTKIISELFFTALYLDLMEKKENVPEL
ncbi:lipase [Aquimarina sp. TRL1]|uniref:lipase n=1 Tax=Aquimarina sp. (strain TRL1) TaxID=2736252 RepID=UPI00158A9369|nr:lipase [Aquimarina sp. TRL1]QKX03477.1 lipase [Aquimarina sp. TRL1]